MKRMKKKIKSEVETMSDFSDSKIKHLEMIQAIITRMSQNSFSLKGWTITLVAGIFALSAKDSQISFFLISYVPIVLFWFLDSYYLQLERKYRVLYNSSIKGNKTETDFNLSPPESDWKQKTYYIQSLISISEVPFYCVLAAIVAVVIYIL